MDMMTTTQQALFQFTERYLTYWQDKHHSLPFSNNYQNIDSPCIEDRDDDGVYWSPKKASNHSFYIVEEVINIKINSSLSAFYCSQYSGDLKAYFNNNPISLIQVWNQDDFIQIEQNIINHLDMLRRRKMRPTVFIGSTEHEHEQIAVDNQTGEVLLTDFHTKTNSVISTSLESFLNLLYPIDDFK